MTNLNRLHLDAAKCDEHERPTTTEQVKKTGMQSQVV